VSAATGSAVVRWQRRASARNRRLAGCVLDRDVGALLAASGLDVLNVRTSYEKGSPRSVGFFYEGRARA